MAGDDDKEETAAAKGGEDEEEDEEDLEKLQAEIARMEAEAARITKETEQLQKKKDGLESSTVGGPAAAGKAAAGGEAPSRDGLSIYVGQVEYSTTPEELLAHFQPCGTVERVTIVCDKITGRPKGFAYLEFGDEAAVELAIKLDGSEFKGRSLKVTHKRVNIAGFSQGPGGRGRGRVMNACALLVTVQHKQTIIKGLDSWKQNKKRPKKEKKTIKKKRRNIEENNQNKRKKTK
ncbi:Embryonic polyadenylate-binding protein 2 [Seminavis robusta]|uniref:Embryonic polyadenylate-binding protein 2 n=1 Tax=Seminavis robusta TaxID=568900 RepID=A0A9N8EX38_9STRA|nr:Embryonic polyadenylate-binding protein 2 [Seminavis robusta]|eukprot:Sro2015_g311090.1 Embryonic polyadenylate-binding protein 2 (234) ;mRNA; r:13374-14630